MKDWRISCIRRTSKHPGLVLLALGSWMFKVMDEFVVELFAIMASL